MHSQAKTPEALYAGCEDVDLPTKPYYNNYEQKDALVIYLEDVSEGIKRELLKEGKSFSG